MAIIDRLTGQRRGEFEVSLPSDHDDCLSCRVLGSTALVSLGGYTYFSGMKQLQDNSKLIEASKIKIGPRRYGIIGLSATFFGLGIYRMLN